MSITDELRGWLKSLYTPNSGTLRAEGMAIADRIDKEHESKVQQAHADGLNEQVDFHDNFIPSNFILLPVDADGEVWHLGDELTIMGEVCEVVGIGGKTIFYACGDGVDWTIAHNNRHHHAPTVENVLEELLREYDRDDSELTNGEIVERFAAKLRLAGEGE